MLLLLGIGFALTAVTPGSDFRWLLAICGYICFFTGVPACAGRLIFKSRLRTPHLRVGTFVFIPVVIFPFVFSKLIAFQIFHFAPPIFDQ